MKTFFGLVLVLLYAAGADCLQCYDCNMCGDPFKESSSVSKVTCPGLCYKASGNLGDNKLVFRGCSERKPEGTCTEMEIYGVKAHVCYCDKDLCNGSSTVNSFTSPRMLLLLAAVVVIKTL